MFPETLDGAKVLEYFKLNKGINAKNYSGIEKSINYIAICQYDDDEQYYLFYCDEKYDVLSDWLFDTIDDCKAFLLQNNI